MPSRGSMHGENLFVRPVSPLMRCEAVFIEIIAMAIDLRKKQRNIGRHVPTRGRGANVGTLF